MKTNKTQIELTAIENHGRVHELYCKTILMLRHARNVGDIEVVNNYVLGKLREHKSFGEMDFIETKVE